MVLSLNSLVRAPGGPSAGDPLVIAHGLYGSARNFNSLAGRMQGARKAVLVDMRNHGESPWDSDCTYGAMAADLAATIEAEASGRAIALGHSMGGKAAMALALLYPERVSALVVADIAPVTYSHSHAHYIEAMRQVDLASVTKRSDADPTLAAAVPEPPLRAFLLQNLVIEGGSARWRINLDGLADGMADLLDWPASLADRTYGGPTLFLHGRASDYVAPKVHPTIRRHFPEAEIEAIDGAGHWLHAEQPQAFAAAVDRFLERL